jgi:hypothetical protein
MFTKVKGGEGMAAAKGAQGSESELKEIDREIVTTLLDTGAVNFEALGRTIASVGPGSALMADDGWIRWCGSDLRIYRWPRDQVVLEDIVILANVFRGLQSKG